MKYCINYNKQSKYIDNCDEINIKYSLQDTVLLEFLMLNKEKRVNIYFENETLENVFAIIDKIYEIKKSDEKLQLFIRLPFVENEIIEKIKNYNIPFYIDSRVNNWDVFNGLINLGVSDIYIVEDLCFDLKNISKTAKKANVQLRAFPNVAQSQWAETPALKKFFIRPEDVETYEPYIDVLEFYGDAKKQDILYKIYNIDKKWFGNLKEIIIGLNSDLDSRFIVPNFATHRTTCKKRCVQGKSCHVCESIEALAETLKLKGLVVDIKKAKSEMKDEEEFKKEMEKKISNKEEK